MEANKPRFCHSCGAALVGEAAFCASCGAKQPAAAPAPSPAPAPAPAPAPVVAPVAPPENALAVPAKASVPAILLGVISLVLVLIAVLMSTFTRANLSMYRGEFGMLLRYIWQTQGWGFIAAWIVPLVALVAAIAKKKPVAIIGLALAALSMVMQLIIMLLYNQIMRGEVRFFGLAQLLRIVNGEYLLMQIRSVFSMPFNIRAWRMYITLVPHLGFILKNVLSLVVCLLAAKKK